MRNTLRALTLSVALFGASAFAQDVAVSLRPHVVAEGPAVTLGDLFESAGAVGGRAVAPAPAPGQTARFSAQFVAAAASAAGLAWTPPEGLRVIEVTRRGGRGQSAARIGADAASPAAVRRGDVVTLVYVAPGLQLTTRARALGNAAIGEPISLLNLQSNQTVDAVVTGPGAASVTPPG